MVSVFCTLYGSTLDFNLGTCFLILSGNLYLILSYQVIRPIYI